MKIELILLSICPILACILWIYIKDKYEKEPIFTLLKFYILGIVVSILAILVEDMLVRISLFEGWLYNLYTSFVVAGMVEEGIKGLILIPVLLKEKDFNEKLDGIIYSILLVLGFATVENILYIVFEDISQAYQIGIVRGLVSIPGHIMFAITMGYYTSKAKFCNNKVKRREYLFLAILLPILLHGLFDFILMLDERWSIILFIVYVVFLGKINLDKLDEYIKDSKRKFKINRKLR